MGRVCRVVPKQWTRYAPVGSVIPGTRFIAFKTPINEPLSTKIFKDQRFNVNDLFRILAEKDISLGLVIDLTDTDRFYDHKDIQNMCVAYEKINCPGRGFIEREELVDSFYCTVDNFLEENSENELLIGVHCTNGINRCGFMICHYLVDRLDWTSHDAIDAFERARGYPIERGSYVQALHRAAKERRTKRHHKYVEEVASSEDDVQKKKRNKHKKRRKMERASGDEYDTPDHLAMNDVLSQMAIAFEQHQSMTSNVVGEVVGKPGADFTNSVETYNSQGSYPVSTEGSPFIGSTGTGEQDGDDEEDETVDQEFPTVLNDEVNGLPSKSKKRRERRLRLQKKFDVLRTGNFWKINEMQKDRLGFG
ncbi:hypothetical protein AB6A40_000021 [Gnathostoma spinigerum]|uniref:Tyrosine specific protein phosphatases domain-containing protein n=1 Tax=Gnathostoma spinigerum TaxID=75299 RepID=A0ABD6EA16_9BILA